ncbi:GntR family transcriptional regulator [Saccharopolyspora sp. 5N708]|uniref:GntR family transcriptional regulator n=1 Tax=Saccharopolyspora sp. 5N708 TaxID=3457424 RepID=UPI003FD05BB9
MEGTIADIPTVDGETPGSVMWLYRRVRDDILNGSLPAGQRISQVRLADSLGVSRPTLREALRMLQNEGLLQAEHNRQMRVAPLDLEDFEQLCLLRLAVEPMGVRITVPRLTDAEIAEVTAHEATTTRLHSEHDFAGAEDAHERFHGLLFSHAGARLNRMAAELRQAAERYRQLLSRLGNEGAIAQIASADHDAIVAAAADRDGELCADLVAQHITRVGIVSISLIEPTFHPQLLHAASKKSHGASRSRR